MSRDPSHYDALAIHGAALGAALVALGADAWVRREWGPDRIDHWVAATVMYVTVATIAAAVAFVGVQAVALVKRWAHPRMPRLAAWLAPIAGAIAGGVLSRSTAFWMFSGEGVKGSTLGAYGPYAVIAAGALGGAIATAGVEWAYRAGRSGARLVPALVIVVFSGTALGLITVDLTFYVALYARLHTALEVAALLSAMAALALVLRAVLGRSRKARFGLLALSTMAAIASIAYVGSPSSRSWSYESLSHVWREPAYAGRMLSRIQIAESFVDDPSGWKGEALSSLERLRRKYDFATTARSPVWDEPLDEPEAFEQRIRSLRARRDYNILVYYVDTLRYDVASDPETMPNAVRFAGEALSFERAYATGSNTLHSLPGLTGGSYDLEQEHPQDMLRVARRAGLSTALFAAQSAREFLGKLLPSFEFEQTYDIPDYARGKEKVWGYGADQPTASRLVDRTLDWLGEHRDERFLTWVFNFDVHNWRELDEAYVRDSAEQLHVTKAGPLNHRYRTVASAVDAQFGRLLGGLDALGLRDDTIVLFVSDHGEGLGRDGFWVHSIFLWESLVHVPLAIRVPGLKPRVIRDPVSLIDVPPTLVRYMVENPETRGYQGEDLLGYLLPGRPPRRLPLMLVGTQKEKPVRIGIIDPDEPYKLVLPFEGAVPELYDLHAADPDGADVSRDHQAAMLGLLNDLVRSPLFPRVEKAEAKDAPKERHASIQGE